MKRINAVFATVVMLACLALAAPNSGSGSLEIASPAVVAGTTLDAGRYDVKWSGEGDAATVVIKNKKSEVSAKAKAVQLASKPGNNQVVRDRDTNSLVELRFRGQTTALVLQ